MQYIRDCDYEYIRNKYHDASKPFDTFQRFIRRDEIFASETGMEGDAIIAGIVEEDAKITHLPHPVRKAKALAYVLANTRIACDRRDIFPAINMIDRPLNKTLIQAWRDEVFTQIIPEVGRRRDWLENDGIVTIWPDYDHSVPDWDRLFALGFPGILRESENARRANVCTPEQDAFFEGVKITYEAILMILDRLAALADATDGSEKLAAGLKQLRVGAPTTFYEALLLSYLYFMISEHIEGLQVRSLSNFDRQLFAFYQHDLESGLTEDDIRTDLAYYLLQFTAIDNYWNQPVYLGGENADGSTVVNELSYLFLDTYDHMGLYNPKIQIKIADSTPKAFVLKALDMIRRGHNSIVLVADATIRKALMGVGVSEEDARLCNITGCYEYSIQGSYVASMNYLNLLKPLEYTLHEGCDGVTGKFAGRVSPPLAAYDTFDKLYAEYKNQLLHVLDMTVDTVNGFEDYLAYMSPSSMLSGTFTSCLESGRDAIRGGGKRNDSIMLVGFIADLVDSLTMIRRYVYEKQEITLERLVAVLDSNFEGEELLRRRLLADREKYGNNKERPDALAVDVVNFLTANVNGRPNSPARGGEWNCGFHVARMSYDQGGKTAASANGRRKGEELSKNISASMGQNREGATAAILSATKIDASQFISDAALDLGLLPSAVKGEDGLQAMYGLLMTFVHRGGHAMHINVFDAETLRAAQREPEKYQDLQIRVCGWNVLFSNINKEEQDGFIRQAESLV